MSYFEAGTSAPPALQTRLSNLVLSICTTVFGPAKIIDAPNTIMATTRTVVLIELFRLFRVTTFHLDIKFKNKFSIR